MLRHTQAILNTTVVVVACAAGVVWLTKPGKGVGSAVQTVDARLLATEVRHVRGRGPLALIELSDFECDYCSRHARTTARELDEQFLNSDRLRHVFINFPRRSHLRAQKAAESTECAAQQGRFWEMHDLLFDGSGALDDDDLIRRAGALRLDMESFKDCLRTGAKTADVARSIETGRRLGVTATPTFFVGAVETDGSITISRRIVGAVEYPHFAFAVTDLLTQLRPSAKQPELSSTR